jgi:hypothetical protein
MGLNLETYYVVLLNGIRNVVLVRQQITELCELTFDMGSVPFMSTVKCRTVSWATLPSIGMFFGLWCITSTGSFL